MKDFLCMVKTLTEVTEFKKQVLQITIFPGPPSSISKGKVLEKEV